MVSKKIVVVGVEYPSFKAASRALDLNYARLRRMNAPVLTSTQVKLLRSDTPIRYSETIEINGTVYPSMSEAARQLGVSRVTIKRHLERGTLHLVGVHGCSGQRRTLKRGNNK